MSGDDFETPSSRDWGDILRLLRQWGTSTLGASVFLLVSSFLFIVVSVADSLFLVLCSKKTAQAQEQVYGAH